MSVGADGEARNSNQAATFLTNISPEGAALMERVAKEMGIGIWVSDDAVDNSGTPLSGDYVAVHRSLPGTDLSEFWRRVQAMESGE